MKYVVTVIQNVKYREECVFSFDVMDRAVNFMQAALKASPAGTEIRLNAELRKEEDDESVQAPQS